MTADRPETPEALAGASRARGTPAFVYVADLPAPGDEFELGEDESHYVSRVCRVRADEMLDASDGRGLRAVLRVLSVGKGVCARVESSGRVPRAFEGCMLSGPPEPGREDWLIEKLAELGLARWIPVDCERGTWDAAARRRGRWERLAIAALKQSRSAHRLEILEPVRLDAAMERLASGTARWLADPAGEAPGPLAPGGWVGAIGPASGFTESEIGRLRAAEFRPVALAPGRLRSETATVALAAVMTALASGQTPVP